MVCGVLSAVRREQARTTRVLLSSASALPRAAVGLVPSPPREVTELASRLLRSLAADRLDQVMRTPLGGLVVEGIFWAMPRYLDERMAARLSVLVRWEVTTEGGETPAIYMLELAEGRARVARGDDGRRAHLTIRLDRAELARLATGRGDPMRDFFAGRIKLGGDVFLAAKLLSGFVLPVAAAAAGRPPAYPAGSAGSA